MSAQFKSVEPDECDAGRHVRARCHHHHAPRPRRPLRATCARHGRQPPRPKRVPARQRLSWPDRVPSRSPDRAWCGLWAQVDAVITSRRMPAPSKRTNAQLGTHGANRRDKPGAARPPRAQAGSGGWASHAARAVLAQSARPDRARVPPTSVACRSSSPGRTRAKHARGRAAGHVRRVGNAPQSLRSVLAAPCGVS